MAQRISFTPYQSYFSWNVNYEFFLLLYKEIYIKYPDKPLHNTMLC